MKPALVAPMGGTWTQFWPLSGSEQECGPTDPTGGTSAGAPHVSGLAAQVRQYFVQGYYPGDSAGSSAGFNPTNALVKAVLINSTRNMTGVAGADSGLESGDRPTFAQGWGLPVLGDSLFLAGEQIAPNPGERPFFLVLTDTPNGLTVPANVNDGRAGIVDSLAPAIAAGEIHDYELCVDDSSDLHVTLVWSDLPGIPGSGDGVAPLRHDLDLELVQELETDANVWRANAGVNTDDPLRLWSSGNSRLQPGVRVFCPTGCTCMGGPDAHENPQDAANLCDFPTRDRYNTVENLFLSASDPDFTAGGTEYVARVVGFELQSDGLDAVPAFPNFDDTDGDATRDFMNDTTQGYALVVSGKVGTPKGLVHFDRAFYACEDRGTGENVGSVLVHDCDGVQGASVLLRSPDTGDCALVTLSAPEPNGFVFPSSSFVLSDVSTGDPIDCATPDAVLVSQDDSVIVAEYVDSSPVVRTATATAHVSCRDVSLASAEALGLVAPCQPSGPITLAPDTEAVLRVTLFNERPWPVTGVIGQLHPAFPEIVSGPVFVAPLSGTLPESVVVHVPIYIPLGDWSGVTHQRFRLELTGDHGFRDRVWIDLPFSDSGTGTGTVLRPDEVPTGEGATEPVRAHIDGFTIPVGEDLTITWEQVTNATFYTVWRGDLRLLAGGTYTHSLPLASLDQGFCNIPAMPGMTNGQTFPEDAKAGTGSRYYLVTAETTCVDGTGGVLTLDGSFGSSRADLDGDGALDSLRDRPAGDLIDLECLP